MSDFEWARDRIIMGAERKSAVISDESRKITAYHEAGHAIIALFTPGALPIHKATIMPRGNALGMVSQLPEEDMLNHTLEQLKAMLDVCYGGRISEAMIFGESKITTGASSDISQVLVKFIIGFEYCEKHDYSFWDGFKKSWCSSI